MTTLETFSPRDPFTRRLLRALAHRRFALGLALVALLLSSSSLFIGFYLDDWVGRYIYSQREGAAHLFELYAGGYGLANAVPTDNHWQIEAGWAPWWIYDQLLIRLFRPLGEWSHRLDAWLWPDWAVGQHVHNLVWLCLLVLLAVRMYRIALGPVLGGLAAILFAFDHTHGFVAGYICNRHALITAALGVGALAAHLRAFEDPAGVGSSAARKGLAAALYAVAMVSGESTIAIGGYLFAHAFLVLRGSLARRALAFAPYAAITLGWRVAYNLAGYGASGSGLYLDPVRQPLEFASAFLERAPVLILGQYLAPPSDLYAVSGPIGSKLILAGAWLFLAALLAALWPVMREDRRARFWALGALLSLVPAASTYPHNRQLLFVSLGAMALIAHLWKLHVVVLEDRAPTRWLGFSRHIGGGLMFAHLILSPLALPFSSCGIVLATPLQSAPNGVSDDVGGRDAVFVTAPDYFAVKLVQLVRRVEGKPLPRRIRALAFGEEQVTVRRTGERTLELDYAGGLLSTQFMELYRDRRLVMPVGYEVRLNGLTIEVLALTPDQRVSRARFSFDMPLESPQFRFYYWAPHGFEPFVVPALGEQRQLPRARLEFGLSVPSREQ